jgi:hypothetical protein
VRRWDVDDLGEAAKCFIQKEVFALYLPQTKPSFRCLRALRIKGGQSFKEQASAVSVT